MFIDYCCGFDAVPIDVSQWQGMGGGSAGGERAHPTFQGPIPIPKVKAIAMLAGPLMMLQSKFLSEGMSMQFQIIAGS